MGFANRARSELTRNWCASMESEHSGLRLNLNLCLFLQTFNAISESEYVKIGSMCIFFLISVIGLSEKQLYTFLGSNLSHVSYQLGKGCCLPTFPQYFAHNLYNAFVAQCTEVGRAPL